MSMDCPLQRAGDLWRCPLCGWNRKARSDRPPRRNCPAQAPDLAPAAAKLGVSLADVAHYARAVTRWTLAGFPTRDASEVARIEAEHCRPCTPHYRAGRCAQCGCRVTSGGLAVVNKIAMATERCPVGKW
jgi:hypothetical protein